MGLREDIAVLNEAASEGVWGQFSPLYGPWKERAKAVMRGPARDFSMLDSSHNISAMTDGMSKPYRIATFRHADDAALAEALVNAYRAGKIEFKE